MTVGARVKKATGHLLSSKYHVIIKQSCQFILMAVDARATCLNDTNSHRNRM